MVATTLFTAIGEMKAQMDDLEVIVAKEVQRQFELLTVDLRTLYRGSKARTKTKERDHSRKPKEDTSVDELVKRSLAYALSLEDLDDEDAGFEKSQDEDLLTSNLLMAMTYDEDEVF